MSDPRPRLRAWLAGLATDVAEGVEALGEGPAIDPLLSRVLALRDRLRAEGRALFVPSSGHPVRLEIEGVRLCIEPRTSPRHRAWCIVDDSEVLHLRAEPARRACGVQTLEQPVREALVARGLSSRTAHRVLRSLRRPGLGDRWIDHALTEVLHTAVDGSIADAVRAGAPTDPVVHAAHTLADLLHEAVHRAVDAWRAPPRLEAQRLLAPRARLPAELAARLPDEGPLVDTDTLPGPLAAEVLALPLEPDVHVLLGDNRHALRLLASQGTTFDAVVEDPPYDTGSALLPYRDAWPEGAWTAMMREHLGLLRQVLAPHAHVLIHVDEHRGADLHRLVVEAFGDGALGAVIWDKRNPKGDARGIASRHERIEWAVPDLAVLHERGGLRRPKPQARRMLDEAARLVAAHEDLDDARTAWSRWVRSAEDLTGGDRAYRHLDAQGRVYRRVSMAWPNRTTPPDTYFQPLTHPLTGQPCPVPKRGWRNPPATMERLLAEGRIEFGVDHTTQPTRRYWLDEMPHERMPSVVTWAGSDDRLLASMGLSFAFGKPVGLLQRLLSTAAADPDARVFDGFGGSGSTAHAVLLSNDADGGRRRCVLVERDPSIARSILIPRLQRILTSRTWDDGRPVGPPRDVVVRVDALVPSRS